MIDKLTPEQIAKFPEYVEKWTAIGLCTDPADRPKAEIAINKCYQLAGLTPPKKIVWCDSPLSQAITHSILKDEKIQKELQVKFKTQSVRASVRDSVWTSVWASVGDSVGASVKDSVRDSVGASVGASVKDSVWASVRASVRDSVWTSVGASVGTSVKDSVRDSVGDSVKDSVWTSVWASVGDSVGASVRDSVRASVWDSVRDSVGASVGASVKDSVWASVRASVRDSVRASVYGQHDASWLSFYNYFNKECGLYEETKLLDGLIELAESAGWWLPCKDICFVSERHSMLNRDNEGRLHNTNGPAFMYPDGFCGYYYHGVKVPEFVITEPNKITPQLIDQESNIEVRRVMLQIYGEERYLTAGNYEVLDEDKDQFGRPRRLLRKQNGEDEPIVKVEVINSSLELDGSYKTYYLSVHPELRPLLSDTERKFGDPQKMTCHNAVASTFGKRGEEYGVVGQVRQGDVFIEFKDGTNILKFRES
jgi:hypothetical protein